MMFRFYIVFYQRIPWKSDRLDLCEENLSNPAYEKSEISTGFNIFKERILYPKQKQLAHQTRNDFSFWTGLVL